jgi:hypothetical protein
MALCSFVVPMPPLILALAMPVRQYTCAMVVKVAIMLKVFGA